MSRERKKKRLFPALIVNFKIVYIGLNVLFIINNFRVINNLFQLCFSKKLDFISLKELSKKNFLYTLFCMFLCNIF